MFKRTTATFLAAAMVFALPLVLVPATSTAQLNRQDYEYRYNQQDQQYQQQYQQNQRAQNQQNQQMRDWQFDQQRQNQQARANQNQNQQARFDQNQDQNQGMMAQQQRLPAHLRGVDPDDIEWDPQSGYHEEEWYDPSDWFDADEGIEYEDTWLGYDYTPSLNQRADEYTAYDNQDGYFDYYDYTENQYGDTDFFDRDYDFENVRMGEGNMNEFYSDQWYNTNNDFNEWYQ